MTGRRTHKSSLIAFGALLVVVIVIVGVTSGFGGPSLPDGAVAFVEEVDEGEVTQEQFDAGLEQAAARQGIRNVPEEGTPQYDLLEESAMADLLLARWVVGEAEEMGISVSDREIDNELERIIEQQFGGQRQFDRFLEQNAFSEEDARDRVQLQLLTARIQEQVIPEEIDVGEDEISDYYERNIAQFETPETRDVRTVLNPDEEQAQQALEQLQDDDSAAGWKGTAEELSTDEATANVGGLRQGVVEGQNEPALDEAIFGAAEGELVGPIETQSGFYVFQVDAIDPASTQPLDEQTSEQIRQTLLNQRQQEIAQTFQTDFISKWTVRTVCADDHLMNRCGNAEPPPDLCAGDDPGEEVPADPQTGEPGELACPAFVPSIQPVPPSSAGDPNATGLPQGPQTGQAAPNPLEGTLPLGTPGAPQGAPPVPGG